MMYGDRPHTSDAMKRIVASRCEPVWAHALSCTALMIDCISLHRIALINAMVGMQCADAGDVQEFRLLPFVVCALACAMMPLALTVLAVHAVCTDLKIPRMPDRLGEMHASLV